MSEKTTGNSAYSKIVKNIFLKRVFPFIMCLVLCFSFVAYQQQQVNRASALFGVDDAAIGVTVAVAVVLSCVLVACGIHYASTDSMHNAVQDLWLNICNASDQTAKNAIQAIASNPLVFAANLHFQCTANAWNAICKCVVDTFGHVKKSFSGLFTVGAMSLTGYAYQQGTAINYNTLNVMTLRPDDYQTNNDVQYKTNQFTVDYIFAQKDPNVSQVKITMPDGTYFIGSTGLYNNGGWSQCVLQPCLFTNTATNRVGIYFPFVNYVAMGFTAALGSSYAAITAKRSTQLAGMGGNVWTQYNTDGSSYNLYCDGTKIRNGQNGAVVSAGPYSNDAEYLHDYLYGDVVNGTTPDSAEVDPTYYPDDVVHGTTYDVPADDTVTVSVPDTLAGDVVNSKDVSTAISDATDYTTSTTATRDLVSDTSDAIPHVSDLTTGDTVTISNANPSDLSTPDKPLDFSPLETALSDRFPFCIPWDLINSIKILVAPSSSPKITLTFNKSDFGWSGTYTVFDLSSYSTLLGILRFFLSLGWLYFLITKTRDFVRG